ncbi:MAG: S-layer homology domain-containing protein [Oscillospiraceae bacterium]|nr:S-layer homology domain-containing protein [Oscillospiraceae bacterium]
MDADKKEKLNALGNKIKEQAAQTAANAESGAKKGLFGFGSKPTANAATTTATNAKPTTATTTSAKPTATTSAKPTTATTSVKPTTTAAASVKPTTATTTAAKKSSFTDVPASAYYADAVEWAVQKGITSGTTPTTFTPANPCHRGHAATFLWRSKGSPAPKTTNNPFTDVAPDSPFYKAILWATENKIIEPKTATTYEPTAPCTRGEVLTYLYRAEGKSGATEADAIKWANLKKLLAGFAGGSNVPCTRADIVTFLYRVKT